MFLKRLRSRQEGKSDERILDSVLPKALKITDGRLLDLIMPKSGLLPSKKGLDTRPKPTAKEASGDYVGDKIEQYKKHLEAAIQVAPCNGCKKLVESAIVGVEIFKKMETEGLKYGDFAEGEVERIRKEVEARYA